MNYQQYDQDTELGWNLSSTQKRSGAIGLILLTAAALGAWWFLS